MGTLVEARTAGTIRAAVRPEQQGNHVSINTAAQAGQPKKLNKSCTYWTYWTHGEGYMKRSCCVKVRGGLQMKRSAPPPQSSKLQHITGST